MMLYIQNVSYNLGTEFLTGILFNVESIPESSPSENLRVSRRKDEIIAAQEYLDKKYFKNQYSDLKPKVILEEQIEEIIEIVETKEVELDPTSDTIPKSKRKYLNPKNNKLVGYTRARNLGII